MNKKNNYLFQVDGSLFSPERPLVIAELGTSHNADLIKAKEMVSSVAETGADCAKFQMVFADEILHPNTGEVTLPGGRIRLYDRFKELETPLEFYTEIKEYTESLGLLFLCTPFGFNSASILRKMSPKMVKIASPELNYTGLLEEIAQWEIPVLLSTGVSKLSDIETAIDIFKEKKNICLLHCVTSYPAPETEYNLRLLPSLTNIFGVPVGISDHSSDPELIPALGVCMGASVIEKHFCLSRKDPGLDDPIALPPDEFTKMVKAVRLSAKTDPEKTYKNYCKKKNRAFIDKILGSGIKELAPCEKANYKYTNRSIHAMRDINAGEILNKGDYAVLRTEKNLRPGLEPCREKNIEGRAVKNFIPSGEGIRFEDI